MVRVGFPTHVIHKLLGAFHYRVYNADDLDLVHDAKRLRVACCVVTGPNDCYFQSYLQWLSDESL